MSGDTGRNSQSPSGSANNSEQSQTPPSTSSSTVRDFLYLDQPKVLSYLSQIDGGLQQLVEQVQKQFNVTDKSDPEFTRRVAATIAGEIQGNAVVVEGQVSGQYQDERATKTGGDRTLAGREGLRATRKTVHHEALEIVVSKLGSRLTTLKGEIEIIDYDRLAEDLSNHDKKLKLFNKVAGQRLESAANMKEMAELIRMSASGKVVCLLKCEGKTYSAFLQKKNLIDDVQAIIDNYGHQPTGEFHLVGLPTSQPHRSESLNSPNMTHVNPIATAYSRSNLDLLLAAQTVNLLWRHVSDEGHFLPIALYREL